MKKLIVSLADVLKKKKKEEPAKPKKSRNEQLKEETLDQRLHRVANSIKLIQGNKKDISKAFLSDTAKDFNKTTEEIAELFEKKYDALTKK